MLRFLRVPSDDSSSHGRNRLHRFIQSVSVQDMAQMAAEINPDVKQVIGMNVQALLGYLPASEFTTTISAGKEQMQSLLASAMLTGYFLHAMENRMLMEEVFQEPKPEAQTAEPLRSPEDLFGAPLASEPDSAAAPVGRFMQGQELLDEIESTEEADIQIEINASSLDLPTLLSELQSLTVAEEPHEDEPLTDS